MHWNDAARNHYHDNAGSFPRQQHNQREFPNAFSRSISHALYTRWEDCAIVRSCISISTLTLVLNRLNIWIQIRSKQIRLDSWVNGKVWVWILNYFSISDLFDLLFRNSGVKCTVSSVRDYKSQFNWLIVAGFTSQSTIKSIYKQNARSSHLIGFGAYTSLINWLIDRVV